MEFQDRQHGGRTRKEILRGLLDALTELSREDEADFPNKVSLQSRLSEPTIPLPDVRAVNISSKDYFQFERETLNLERKLHDFAIAANQLGCSVGILLGVYMLRCSLTQILSLFRENAADLFPEKIRHRKPSTSTGGSPDLATESTWPPTAGLSINNLLAPRPIADPEVNSSLFPDHMRFFAQNLSKFAEALGEYGPEFEDEAFKAAIASLQGNIEYQSACMAEFKRDESGSKPAVKRLIYDMSGEIALQINSVADFLPEFTKDIEHVLFAQNHDVGTLQSLSTVATFFSGVTATTLQFSFGAHDGALENAVNSFWFTSLVLSISAAVSSLLAVTWKQSSYRSPRADVPWLVSAFLKNSPLYFLVISIACFSVGLILFAFSSNQHPVTLALTTAFSSGSIMGITGVAAWVTLERWAFGRYHGAKRAIQVLGEFKHLLMDALFYQPPTKDIEHGNPPLAHQTNAPPVSPAIPLRRAPRVPVNAKEKPADVMFKPKQHRQEWDVDLAVFRMDTQADSPNNGDDNFVSELEDMQRHLHTVEQLRVCDVKANILPPVVRSMQFSPRGDLLVVCGGDWAPWWALFNLDNDTRTWYKSVFRYHESVHGATWSPSGNRLLLRTKETVEIWSISVEAWSTSVECEMEFNHDSLKSARSIAWCTDEQGILVAKDNTLMRLDLEKKELDSFVFDNGVTLTKILAIPSTHEQILCVGMEGEAQNGVLIACNIGGTEWQIESRVSVPYTVHDLVLSRNGRLGLISHMEKENATSQLLRLTRPSDTEQCIALILSRSYKNRTMENTTSVTPSTFGGRNEELVMCAGAAGDIRIWQRQSGAFLHHIPAPHTPENTELLRRPSPVCVTSTILEYLPSSLIVAAGHTGGFVSVWMAPIDADSADDASHRGAVVEPQRVEAGVGSA